MRYSALLGTVLVLGAAAAMADRGAQAQTADPNSAPNPYHIDNSWSPQLPAGRKLGAAIGIALDKDGKSLWVYERCGADTCEGSNLDPIFKFDPSGKVVANFGGGKVNWPHGFTVDKDDNVWVTDGRAGNGKGHDVIKFSPDGKVLLTLGKPGTAGLADDEFNTPSDVHVGPNGDIFVADGHGLINKVVTNDRIVKLTKDGKFIKAWSKHGSAAAELDTPHKLAIDSQNRLFVADRVNNRMLLKLNGAMRKSGGAVLIETKVRTRCGCREQTICAMAAPRDIPTRWADSHPTASRTDTVSSAISSSR